jgi:hypothetical protein
MTFLYAFLIVTGVPMFHVIFNGYFAMAAASVDEARSAHSSERLNKYLLGSMMICSAYMVGLILDISQSYDTTIAANSHNWSPLIFLAASCTAMFVYVVLLNNALHRQTTRWQAAWVFALCSGFYIGIASMDHILFWKDTDRVGLTTEALYKGTDVECESGIILLKKEDNGYRYRCPKNVVLGHPLIEPFVPWPAYSEGISLQLKGKIAEVMKQPRGREAELAK